MNEIILNKEAALIRSIAGDFPRHPRQVNALLEADAEIIALPGSDDGYLVLKTDGIHEEIRERLYEDPYLIGWMTVTAPLSDVAAVGAEPTGLLLSLVLPKDMNTAWLQQFKAGIHAACLAYHVYVLGGDTNFDAAFSASATAVAYIKSRKPLLRTGIQPGDYLYATAPLGAGNAYAYYRLFDATVPVPYRPVARLHESKLINGWATACMDTSDGLFPALSMLCEVNNTGFDLTLPLEGALHASALPVQRSSGLPAWMFMAGPHGEYELLFTVSETTHEEFVLAGKDQVWQPLLLGRATTEKQLCFFSGSLRVQCAAATIANLFYEAHGDIPAYFRLLQKQHKEWSGHKSTA